MVTLVRTSNDTTTENHTADELAGMGVFPPRYTTTTRNALVNPSAGLIILNTTTNKLNVYLNGAWEAITSA